MIHFRLSNSKPDVSDSLAPTTWPPHAATCAFSPTRWSLTQTPAVIHRAASCPLSMAFWHSGIPVFRYSRGRGSQCPTGRLPGGRRSARRTASPESERAKKRTGNREETGGMEAERIAAWRGCSRVWKVLRFACPGWIHILEWTGRCIHM